MVCIILENLVYSYNLYLIGFVDYVLKQMDYVWQDGGVYVLLGVLGCGKIMFLNIILGLLIFSQGWILFGDCDVIYVVIVECNIVQVFQFLVVYDMMIVCDNLVFLLKNCGKDVVYIKVCVDQIVCMIGMEVVLGCCVQGLIVDVKQKISLGWGMVCEDVNVILFDELLIVIDLQMKWELCSQLKQLYCQFGYMMIYVIYDQIEVLIFVDKVVVMYDGCVVQMGMFEELFEVLVYSFVGYFIGFLGMNFLDVQVQGCQVRLVDGVMLDLGVDYGMFLGWVQIGICFEYVYVGGVGDLLGGLFIVLCWIEDVGCYWILCVELVGKSFNVLLFEGEVLLGEGVCVSFVLGKLGVYVDDWCIVFV